MTGIIPDLAEETEHGQIPRMSATGYSSTRPLVPESDPTALSVNRRVDIVVLSTASAEANALLPGIEAANQEAHP